MTTDLLTIAVQGVNDAADTLIRIANDQGIRNMIRAALNGTLAIEVGQNHDGTVWGRYIDASRLECWDDCDGILTFHRAGWCPFVAEHADLDCACMESHAEAEMTDEDWKLDDDRHEMEAMRYGDYVPDLADGLGVVIDPEDEEFAWWLIDGVWDGLDDGYEPDFESMAERGFDEDYAISQAENRYERWLGRS